MPKQSPLTKEYFDKRLHRMDKILERITLTLDWITPILKENLRELKKDFAYLKKTLDSYTVKLNKILKNTEPALLKLP